MDSITYNLPAIPTFYQNQPTTFLSPRVRRVMGIVNQMIERFSESHGIPASTGREIDPCAYAGQLDDLGEQVVLPAGFVKQASLRRKGFSHDDTAPKHFPPADLLIGP